MASAAPDATRTPVAMRFARLCTIARPLYYNRDCSQQKEQARAFDPGLTIRARGAPRSASLTSSGHVLGDRAAASFTLTHDPAI